MFRVADMRKRTAIGPRIVAHLYTWGTGHTTAEGEYIPVQVGRPTLWATLGVDSACMD